MQEFNDGDVRFWRIAGEDVHEAINVGNTGWRNIVVELKEVSRALRIYPSGISVSRIRFPSAVASIR